MRPSSQFVLSSVVWGVLSTAASAAELTVCKSGCSYTDLQAALNAAKPGDTIKLRAGETFVGNYTLPAKSGASASAYITITSDAPASALPAAGVRLVPSGRTGSNTSLSSLPRLLGKGGLYKNTPVVRTAAGASYYALRFLRIDGTANEGFETLIGLGDDKADTARAHHIILDRIYAHGHKYKGQKRGIAMNGNHLSVINSYLADFKAVLTDSQGIAGYNGAGPMTIVNNYIEGSSENIMFGGSGPAIANLIPSDIVIRRNHLYKPTAWRNDILSKPGSPRATATTGGSLAARTHYFKVVAIMVTGSRTATSLPSAEVSATVGSNGAATISWSGVSGAERYRIYRGTAAGGQTVYLETTSASTSFTYKGSSEKSGKPPTSGTRWVIKNLFELKNARRVTVDGNVFQNTWHAGQTGYAIVLTPRNASGSAPWSTVESVTFTNNVIRSASGGVNILGHDDTDTSGRTRYITFRNNLFHDIDPSKYGGLAKVFLLGGGPENVVIDSNTIVHTNSSVVYAYSTETTKGFVYKNNNSQHNTYGILGDGTRSGIPTITKHFPGGVVQCNVLAGGPASAYPATNLFPSVTDWKSSFVNYSGGDYTLRSGSVVAEAGCGTTIPGVNMSALTAAYSGTASLPPTEPTEPPPTDPTDPPPSTTNVAPTAEAGGPYSGTRSADLVTDGSQSDDRDGSIALWRWTWADELLVRAVDLQASAIVGSEWVRTSASGAAGGVVLSNTNRNATKRAVLAKPASYVEFRVPVAAGVPYKLWMRMRATGDDYGNDSLSLQFSGATNAQGTPIARIGTTSALAIILENGKGAGLSGWGWNDDQYEGTAPVIYFAQSGMQTIRIQQREDGIMWDQLVLSSVAYKTASPGDFKQDTTLIDSDFGKSDGVIGRHRYAVAGTYPVRLTVVDDKGAIASDSAVVTIKP